MKGYRITRDEKRAKIILEGLLKKDGYCPCKVQKIPENLCPCDGLIYEGKCCCGFFEKDE
jgi:hypothetical protein